MKTFVQKLAPAHAERLYQSRNSAESYLTDEDPKLRLAAVIVIAHHWGLDAAFKNACDKLLKEDSDADVRLYALSYLAYGCYHTDDAAVGKKIGEIIYDNSEPRRLRLAAYHALFHLRALAHATVAKKNRPTTRGFRFPEDVDWRFVDTFLFGGTKLGTHPNEIDGLLFS